MNVKVFADGADLKSIVELYRNPNIEGFTTNPTLMKKAGIKDYRGFAKEVLTVIKDRPISFEVFSDEFGEMERQALEIASWGENVNVKIPITNTKGVYTTDLISRLSASKVKLNVTAIMTIDQVVTARDALGAHCAQSYISVFAGRIADTGVDPLPVMKKSVAALNNYPIELIWASPRELLNIMQASSIGCDIITVTPDILKKLSMVGYNLKQLSLDTVNMFYNDAKAAGFSL